MKEAEDILKAKQPRKTEEMTDEDRHRFLAYLMPQLEPLRQACEHNWLIQAVLITLATFNLYNSTLVSGVASAAKIPVESLDLVIPIVLTYLVLRMGYLLNAYLFIRDGITTMLSAFTKCPPEFQSPQGERMLRANSLVELFCLNYNKDNFRWYNLPLVVLPLLLAAIFALSHALVLLYLGRLLGHRRGLSVPLALAILFLVGIAYVQFIGNTSNRKSAKLIAVTVMVLILPLFLLMHNTVYGLFW
ncbi:MAG TPA: hypothetical protein VF397_07630 [Pyrinomonadaceae bacterium]